VRNALQQLLCIAKMHSQVCESLTGSVASGMPVFLMFTTAPPEPVPSQQRPNAMSTIATLGYRQPSVADRIAAGFHAFLRAIAAADQRSGRTVPFGL